MEKIGIGRLTLKKQTRANVLKTIKNEGPISRVDIAIRLGLTRAAITIISDELIELGLISEVGSDSAKNGKKSQGRRKILLDINANFKFAFGICATKNHISMGLSTLGGDSLDKVNFDIDANNLTVEKFCEMAKNTFNDLLKSNYINIEKIIGIGIGCDVEFYESIGLKDSASKSLAKAMYKTFNLPICIEYSNLTLALANIYFFEKSDNVVVSDAIFLQCGERFGMIEFSSAAKNFDIKNDWTYIDNYVINFNGKVCKGYPNGSLKAEVSPKAIREKIAQKCPDMNRELIEMIMQGYNSESVSDAIEVKRESLKMFATFLYNIAQTKKVQRIILHKFHFSDFDYSYLIKYIETKFENTNITKIICKSRIDDKYSFLGGCALAVREFFVECGGLDLKIKNKD